MAHYLIRRAIISVITLIAISAVIFLTTPETRIMTQQILNETNAARFGNALAYCVILIAIVCAAIAFLYWIIGSTTRAERLTMNSSSACA